MFSIVTEGTDFFVIPILEMISFHHCTCLKVLEILLNHESTLTKVFSKPYLKSILLGEETEG